MFCVNCNKKVPTYTIEHSKIRRVYDKDGFFQDLTHLINDDPEIHYCNICDSEINSELEFFNSYEQIFNGFFSDIENEIIEVYNSNPDNFDYYGEYSKHNYIQLLIDDRNSTLTVIKIQNGYLAENEV